jgi:hypothetical protein
MAVMSAARPLFYRKRKSARDLAMSHKCLEATYAPQQRTPLFDDLVGKSEQLRWQFWAERLESQKINRP